LSTQESENIAMAASSSTKSTPVHGKQETGDAFATIIRQNFSTMLTWEPVAALGTDIEGVHQMRVVLRRMRSAVIIFRGAIPRVASDPVGEEMRWAANALGPARDLDVFIDEGLAPMSGRIPLRPEGEAKLLAIATARKAAAYVQVREMIASARYIQFRQSLPQWLDSKAWEQQAMTPAQSKALRGSILSYARNILTKRMRIVLQTGMDMDNKTADELHQLRIECKKLRYATEFFTPLFDREAMDPFVLALKELQGTLGVLNDVAVTRHLLESLLDGATDPDVFAYAGAIMGWRARQYEELRTQLTPQWSNFSRMVSPWMK
jgi:CHAD domain-containing protein